MKKLVLPILFIVLLTMPNSAMAGGTAAALNGTDRSHWAGAWHLDRGASDAIRPLLKLMEAPFLARMIANSIRPTLSITVLAEGGLRILNKNPIQNSDVEMPADGTARERTDQLGRKVVSSESWNDAGELVVNQQSFVGGDRVVMVMSTWARVGENLELTNRVETDDGPLVIRRIFRRRS